MKYIWSLALLSVLSLSGCGGGSPLTLTEDNYNKIQNDMSEADVKAILGAPSNEDSKPIPIVGGTETTLVYTNTQNGTTVTIDLKNDKSRTRRAISGSSRLRLVAYRVVIQPGTFYF